MKLLYTFLISFLLFSFKTMSAKAAEVEIKNLIRYIASAEKCLDSIESLSNFKVIKESGAYDKIRGMWVPVMTSRNYKPYSIKSLILFYKEVEYSGVNTESCTEGINELYIENIKN